MAAGRTGEEVEVDLEGKRKVQAVPARELLPHIPGVPDYDSRSLRLHPSLSMSHLIH